MTVIMEQIKTLRAESGAGVMDCRLALEEAQGNYGEALAALREKAAKDAAKRADRPASSGVIELYQHGEGRIGVMVEINSETDFAARSEAFRAFAHEIALQIAAAAPLYVSDADIPEAALADERRKALERAQREGKPEAVAQRIVTGMVEKYMDQTVLLRQVSIRDDQQTIAALLAQTADRVGENVVIRRFLRWERGEGDEEIEGEL